MTGTPPPATAPRASVIVAAHPGTSNGLEQCLTSLLRQDVPASDYEVLIVTSPRDDESAKLVQRLVVDHPSHRLRLLQSQAESVGAARNVALDNTYGEHVVFVDADDFVSQVYLSALLESADNLCVPMAAIVGTPDGEVGVGSDGETLSTSRTEDLVEISDSGVHRFTSTGKLFPRHWIGNVRFDESLAHGSDAVFNAHVFRPFARRFARCNAAPMRAGARYHRRRLERSEFLPASDYDASVRQRLELLRVLTDLDLDPRDRAPLTDALVREYAAEVAQVLQERPEFREPTEVDLTAMSLRGVDVATVRSRRWPGYETVMGRPGPGHAGPVALVAGTSGSIVLHRRAISFLADRDLEITASFLTGAIGNNFPDIDWRRLRIIHEQPAGSPRHGDKRPVSSRLRRADRVGRKVLRRVALRLVPLPVLARYVDRSHGSAPTLSESPSVVLLDEAGEVLAQALHLDAHPKEWLDAQVLATAAVAVKISVAEAQVVARAAEALTALPSDSPDLPPPQVWTLASLRLIRNFRRAAARKVLAAARSAYPAAAASHGWDVLGLLADILEHGHLPSGWSPACREVMAEADRLMALGATDHSLFLIEHTIEVLLHPEVHANVEDPPLIRDPQALLRPLSDSRVWRDLTAPVAPPIRTPSGAVHPGERKPSVLLLPGAYPKFSAAVQAALEGYADTDVLRLTDFAPHYGSTNPSLSLLALRHAAAQGEHLEINSDIVEAFTGRDIVFADWADKGAMLASMFAPPDAKLVIRFHGVDSLSVWQFLIDWSRVTDVVFVSEHLRRTVIGHLGDQLTDVRQHVMGHALDGSRFDRVTNPSAPRTLGLVGWGQRVKDPLWALEVLAALRADNPDWRLKLIGPDFPSAPNRMSERAYAEAFRERALRPDIRSAITYVGYTRDVASHVADVGFALSTSLRESWHIGVVEMVASGAVPVIRDWPVYRDHGGAASLFPEDWIVQTPEEAASRILAHADHGVWRTAADTARQYVFDAFGSGSAAAEYRRIILGT